jgi:hypothetical protein
MFHNTVVFGSIYVMYYKTSVQSGAHFKAETSLKRNDIKEICIESVCNTLFGEGNDINI